MIDIEGRRERPWLCTRVLATSHTRLSHDPWISAMAWPLNSDTPTQAKADRLSLREYYEMLPQLIGEALQRLWPQTSLGKTPKTLWGKWGKSAVFDEEYKYKYKENCSATPTSWNPTMIKTTNESSQTTKAEFFIRSACLRPEIGSFAMVDQWVERRARIVMRWWVDRWIERRRWPEIGFRWFEAKINGTWCRCR